MTTILIVDDEESDLTGLSAILEPVGYRVLLARDADEALEKYLAERVHLVLTDMVMPGRGGLDLIGALRGIDPGARIIAISGKSRRHLEASMVFGAGAVLAKPIERDELLATVEEVLGSNGAGT